MAFKNAAPCDVYREQILLNGASYDYVGAAGGVTSDEYETNANIEGMPARQSHVHDITAYGANVGTTTTGSSWSTRIRSDFSSPARVGTAGWQLLNPGTP